MKKTLLIVLAAVGLSACGNNPRKTTADMPQSDCVEVLCFHGAKRCATQSSCCLSAVGFRGLFPQATNAAATSNNNLFMANYFVSSCLTSASDNFRPLATTCSSTTNAGRVITL